MIPINGGEDEDLSLERSRASRSSAGPLRPWIRTVSPPNGRE